MGRRVLAVAAAAVLALGLGACGSKEKQALRDRVAALEQQLTRANADLAASEGRVAGLEARVAQLQGGLAACRVERDRLKAEIAALHRKYGVRSKTKNK